MARLVRPSLKFEAAAVVALAVVVCCCLNGVAGDLEKVQHNRIVPMNYVDTVPPAVKDVTNNTAATTEEPFKPSDWTPIIILVMFLFGFAMVGIPSIVSYRMREQRQVKAKQRKYTVSLTLVDPNEANGFTRL